MRKVLFITRSCRDFCINIATRLHEFWKKDIRVEVVFTEASENDISAANIVLQAIHDGWINASKGYSDEELVNKYETLVTNSDNGGHHYADICRYWDGFALSEDVKAYCEGDIFRNIVYTDFIKPRCYEHILIDIALLNEDERVLFNGDYKLVSSMGLYRILRDDYIKADVYTAAPEPDDMLTNWGNIWQEFYGIAAPRVVTNIAEVIK